MISSDDFALRTCFGFKSTALKRKFPAGSKSRVNSGFVTEQPLSGSLVPHRAPNVTRNCTVTGQPESRHGKGSLRPTPALHPAAPQQGAFNRRERSASACVVRDEASASACHKRTSRPFDSSPPGDGLVRASTVPGLVHVNRRSNLTPHWLPILSPLSGGVWW
jgi:hypothetical protein